MVVFSIVEDGLFSFKCILNHYWNNYFNSGRYFNRGCDVKLSLKFILNHYWHNYFNNGRYFKSGCNKACIPGVRVLVIPPPPTPGRSYSQFSLTLSTWHLSKVTGSWIHTDQNFKFGFAFSMLFQTKHYYLYSRKIKLHWRISCHQRSQVLPTRIFKISLKSQARTVHAHFGERERGWGYVLSYCKYWIYWVGVNTKFTIWQL